MMDVVAFIGATARVVEDRVHEGKPVRVVIATRTYDTTREDLWDALTNPERLPRWFAAVEGEFRPGGRYQVKGNAGGTIKRCDAPDRLELTWEFGGDVSWVKVELADAPGGARLTLEHMANINDHWKKFGPGAVGIGWELGLAGLDRHLAGDMKDTSEGMAWMMSDEGKAFVRGSGEGWIAADIASGADKADATQRGRATICFYLGEPPPGTQHPGQTS